MENLDYSAMLAETLTMIIVWGLVMLWRAYSATTTQFSFPEWIRSNMNRFIVGLIFTIGIVVLNAMSQDVSELFRAIGFTTEKTTISFGLAIAAILLGGLKPSALPEKEQTDNAPPANEPNGLNDPAHEPQ